MKTLRCHALYKSFDGVQALSGVQAEFPPSGVVGIIGPNGAGKTTLLNIISGFLRPDSGQIFFGTYESTHLPPHQITRLGIARTFQDLRLVGGASVLDNVLLACPDQKGERLLGSLLRFGVAEQEERNREKALNLLRFVSLEEKALKLASELSYGQQKLLTLACSLATEAQVLLLDEPVTGVHPAIASRILDLLCQLATDGKLLIFVEHDISSVKKIADLIIVMDKGRVIAQGSQEVLERPDILEAYVG